MIQAQLIKTRALQTMYVLDRKKPEWICIKNIVTGEEVLGKKQVLPLLQISILGQKHIAQHCLRQHFCKYCSSSPCISPPHPPKFLQINVQLSYNQTTNLKKTQTIVICTKNPDYVNVCLNKRRYKLFLECHLNQRKLHL